MPKPWTIKALDTGSSVIDRSVITYLVGCGEPVKIPRVMFVLEGATTVVVDTSVPPGAAAAEFIGEQFERSTEQELLPGLHGVPVPGHTPGSQAVLVDTAEGRYCIAGDAVMSYDNLDRDVPGGFHLQVDDSMDSMDLLRRRADHVLPSHDYRLFPTGGVSVFPAPGTPAPGTPAAGRRSSPSSSTSERRSA